MWRPGNNPQAPFLPHPQDLQQGRAPSARSALFANQNAPRACMKPRFNVRKGPGLSSAGVAPAGTPGSFSSTSAPSSSASASSASASSGTSAVPQALEDAHPTRKFNIVFFILMEVRGGHSLLLLGLLVLVRLLFLLVFSQAPFLSSGVVHGTSDWPAPTRLRGMGVCWPAWRPSVSIRLRS